MERPARGLEDSEDRLGCCVVAGACEKGLLKGDAAEFGGLVEASTAAGADTSVGFPNALKGLGIVGVSFAF